MEKVAEQGNLNNIDEIPDNIKKIYEVSHNISAQDHIMMQAAFQKYVTNAVSKTVNFPFSASVDEVKKGYMLAWKAGCKGCTVYRDGSRSNQVLNIKEVKKVTTKHAQLKKKIEVAPIVASEAELDECTWC